MSTTFTDFALFIAGGIFSLVMRAELQAWKRGERR